jgi:hypothetical protein
MSKVIDLDETLFPGVVFTEDDLMTEDEINDWLYGEGSDDDDAWVAMMTNKAH